MSYAFSALPRNLNATFRDIKHPKARVRLSALQDLVRWCEGEERARAVLALVSTMTSDEDVEVRASAALALADVAATEALEALIEAARTGPPRLRQMALVGVGELAPPGLAAALGVVRWSLASEAPALRFQALVAAHRLMSDAELVPELERALSDGEARVRYLAVRIIEERYYAPVSSGAAPAELERALLGAASDPDPAVAMAVALIQARLGSEAARTLIVQKLNRARSFAQLEDEQAALELCAELGWSEALPGLRARAFGGLFGSSHPLSFQACVALARLGDERACSQILRGLASLRRSVRARAVAAAGQAKLARARPRLLQMSADASMADGHAVAEALAAIDGSRGAAPGRQNSLVTPGREY